MLCRDCCHKMIWGAFGLKDGYGSDVQYTYCLKEYADFVDKYITKQKCGRLNHTEEENECVSQNLRLFRVSDEHLENGTGYIISFLLRWWTLLMMEAIWLGSSDQQEKMPSIHPQGPSTWEFLFMYSQMLTQAPSSACQLASHFAPVLWDIIKGSPGVHNCWHFHDDTCHEDPFGDNPVHTLMMAGYTLWPSGAAFSMLAPLNQHHSDWVHIGFLHLLHKEASLSQLQQAPGPLLMHS